MDFNKIWEASKKPIKFILAFNILFFVIAILSIVLIGGKVNFVNETGMLIPLILILGYLILYLGNAALYLYSGYNAVRSHSLKVLDSSIVAIVSYIASLTILTFLSAFVSAISNTLMYGSAAEEMGALVVLIGGLSLFTVLISYVMSLVIGVPINFILGAVGGFIAQETKPKKTKKVGKKKK